jgi:hypothetical protein
MSWRKAVGGLAVAVVIGAVVGVLITLATANDLFLGSAQMTAAIVSLVVVFAGLLGIVVLGGPSREWVGNPYW